MDVAAIYNAYANLNIAVTQAFLGNGNGTFSNPETASYAGSNPAAAVTAADVNGDGKLDLVTSFLAVSLGNGDGTFASALTAQYSCTGYTAPLIADFNGDGKLDVLTSCPDADAPSIALYLGNGDGTFRQPCLPKRSPTWWD